MNLDKIKEIVNGEDSSIVKEGKIIQVLAEDESVVQNVVQILSAERFEKKEMLSDMNIELSRAHIFIDENMDKRAIVGNADKSFVTGKIAEFYFKYKGKVSHCFNRFN